MRHTWVAFKSVYPLFAVSSLLFLTGCASTMSPSGEGPSNASASIPAMAKWNTFDNPMAANFSATCQTDLGLASTQFKALEAGKRTDAQLLNQINSLEVSLDKVASAASLNSNVHPNAKVREAGEQCEQKTMALISEISLSRPLYNQLIAVDTKKLNRLDQRYVAKMLRDFKLSGVDKSQATRERLTEINDEITKVGQEFNKNIREDIREVVTTVAALDGLPQDYIDKHKPDAKGRVTLNTTYPDYIPVTKYAHSDQLRLDMYKAFRQRGYPANKPVLKQLLELRYEYANLVGFDNWADYVTSSKMIGSGANAQNFIDKISRIAKPRSDSDYQTLLARLKKIDPSATEVGDWQKAYLENLIKTEVYQVDSQVVRQYFSYDNVRTGIFDLVEMLFDVKIEPWQAEVWHPSVATYQIKEKGQVLGQFYLDMHPRDGKYGHAAHFGIRQGVKGIQTPISALICNFPGGDGGEGLMEHGQVETFLHEFGHLLHSMFGGHQPRLALSGISTEWDFVEAPSQMLEEWVWDAHTLKTFARDAAGKTIPDDLINKMRAARDVGKGLLTRYQMFYAALSLNYYNRPPSEVDLDEMMLSLQNQYAPFGYVDDTHFYASFGHLDGYSAIYYTYMWSLVIAADMFTEFEKHGLRNPEVAKRYREAVLAAGGTKDAADLVKDFLGRPYNFDAFAKQLTGE